MKIIDTHGTFEEAIARSTPEARELGRGVLELIEAHYPGVVVVPWPRQQTVGFGIGPKKMSEHFSYLDAHRNHVNFGFNYGASLEDPEGLLEGTGKMFRHIKIRTPADLEQPGIDALLEAAIRERKRALGRDD